MVEGLKITAACLPDSELIRIVDKLGRLGLIEIDILDGKFIIRDELEQMVLDYSTLKECSAIDFIQDLEWDLV